ncbi:type 2 lanthipeptide synthetase LanM family protein [Kitasatospora cystarginea]|uniref:Type 2 lanthipeptide synthetase LanM family protein n=1 Tax=Kitasatospora cystarginea TaxID=58350 RepID=A0ABN3DP80_9ACTN
MTESQSNCPEWAGFVDAAVSAAPTTSAPARGELPGTSGFALVLAPLAAAAADRVPVIPGADSMALRAGFVRQLSARLARLAARALVLELHVCRVTGRLSGDTPSDRFRSFVGLMATRDGLSRLFADYPVLARLLGQACLQAAAARTELLERFAADRSLIVDTLLAGRDPGALTEVESGAGDHHRGGRSVSLLRFAGGARVVYKPRPVTAHRCFNELADWLNARLGERELCTLALLERPGYGWAEFVAQRPCGSEPQLERFYHRQGVLLALLHVLDGTDVHHENVIARADEPVLIDVETLFHPTLPLPSATAEDPAALVLRSSVYRTGLLPSLHLGDETAWDASGLGADRGAPLPMETVDWEGAGTDEMRLVRRVRPFDGARNRPRLGGRDADPAGYTGSLLTGFRAGYRTIAAHRHQLTGLLDRFAAAEVRVVIRASQLYAQLLDESTHPDVLRDAAERDGLLAEVRERSLGDPVRPRLVDDEIAQLWNGDLPLFTSRPGTADLWNGHGERIAGILGEPGLTRAAGKIEAMSEADLRDQEWIIRAALAARCPGTTPTTARPGRGRKAAAPPAPERLLAAACRIGDRLVATARRGPSRVNWLGLELLEHRYWRLGSMGAGLGEGYCGPALFLARLGRLTGRARYAEPARQALRPLPALLAALAERPDQLGYIGTGAFAGLGGIAYALTQVSAALDDAEIAGWVEPAVHLAAGAAAAEQEPGVVAGRAGGLVSLLAVHRATGSAEAWQAARSCAELLAAGPLPGAAGFAYGSAGVGWALLAFAAAGGDPRFERAGLAVLRAEVPPTGEPSWCHGLSGTALAVAASPVAAADPALAPVLDRAVRDIAESGPPADHSLCHGELGVLELLQAVPGPVAEAARARRAEALLADLEQGGARCGTPGGVVSPGLLTGLAGLGYGLLRLGFPDRTPSALLLQPPIPDRASAATP